MGNMLDSRRYLEIKFEELISKPQPILENVCDFIGERYEDEMLNFQHRCKKVVGHLSVIHSHLNEPLLQSQIFKWKGELSNLDKCVCDKVAGVILEQFGYERWQGSHPLTNLKNGFFVFAREY